MKVLRNLVLADIVLLIALGWGIGLVYPHSLSAVSPEVRPYQEMATLRLLGTALGGSGFVLLALSTLPLVGDFRRLALWLSVANGMVAMMAFMQQTAIWESKVGWLLVLIFFVMTVGLAWAGSLLKPQEVTAELAMLMIPEEIRQALLSQVRDTAAQEERNRLARDLHDSIKQQLFTINVSAAAVQERWDGDPEGARKSLADVRRSAREAMVEMVALLHQLRPQALTVPGLVEALREQCEALGYRTGAEVRLELGESLPEDRLPAGALETLFRIAQESLANVARHARARHVRIWLSCDGDTALLRVDDDGQGFDPAVPSRSGMGLRNLRERAEALHANLEVVSAPTEGTTVAVRIPLIPPPPPPVKAAKGGQDSRLALLNFSLFTLFWAFRLVEMDRGWDLAIVDGVLTASSFSQAFVWDWRVRSALRSRGATSPASLADLRYVSHRNAALFFLLTAGLAPWSWRLGRVWTGWTVFWLATALLATIATGIEVFKLHRASAIRRRWWRATRLQPNVGRWIFLGVLVFVVGMNVVISWMESSLPPPHSPVFEAFKPEPEEIAFLVLVTSLLLYIRTRQPPGEGTEAEAA